MKTLETNDWMILNSIIYKIYTTEDARTMREQLIEQILPVIISVIELIGIFIVTVGTLRAFFYYLLDLFKIKKYPVKHELDNALATGLEFKMAAEILKTVLITSLSELTVLGCIILLRALLSLLIHIEMKNDEEA